MNNNYQNGRVTNITNNNYKSAPMWETDYERKNFQYQSMIGIQEPTMLNTVFFFTRKFK